jgi:glycosyltransferase involved in cell wall biosynthesis
MNCSIVIRAYNEARHLPRLLEGISHQTIKEVEVLLVDSGSTDDTVSIAESFGARVVRIAPEEFTFGRSLNLGIQAAKHEYIVIASAHVYPVYPDWLECLLRPLEDEKVAVVYGKQRGTDSSKFSEHQIFQQWFPETDVARQPSPFCNNANAAIRRSLWEKHPYDETLPGLEDVAWAKWAQSQSWEVAYASKAEIIHAHNEKPGDVLNRYRREGMAFKHIFPESHFNVYDFVRLTTTNILSDLGHAAHERVFLQNLPSIFWFRTMQFWGTYQGYRTSGPLTAHLRQTFYYPRGMDALSEPRQRDVQPIEYKQPKLPP